jgi:hypothetical protein
MFLFLLIVGAILKKDRRSFERNILNIYPAIYNLLLFNINVIKFGWA